MLRAQDRNAALAPLRVDRFSSAAGAACAIAFLGSETPRERVWIQMDAHVDHAAMSLAAWAAVDSLTSNRAAQYRVPVLARAQVAIVFGESSLDAAPCADTPVLDAGAIGASPAILRAIQRYGPTLLIHVQDWTCDEKTPLVTRLVESFRIAPEVHAALPPNGQGRRFTRARGAFSAVATGPDWLVGTALTEYLRRQGYPLSDFVRPNAGTSGNDSTAVHVLAPGRCVPALPYRRLGGGNLAELSLAACGAHGITAQLRGGRARERAEVALAVAEAAIVTRLGLVTEAAVS